MTAQPARSRAVQVSLGDAAEFAALVGRTAEIYGAAMNRSTQLVVQRRSIMSGHVDRQGFVAAFARDHDEVVGFGYGYLGRAGEWWHDVVADALGEPAAARWLANAFELAELHVDPSHQGMGVGRRLLETVLAATPAPTVVLSTHDRESPARALYRSVGFVDLLGGFFFPGSGEVYAVLGLDR